MSRVLGIDYGEKRVGFALSDATRFLATPHSVHIREKPGDDVAAVLCLLREHRITKVVVGLPLNMDGSEGPAVEKVRAFIERLRKALDAADLANVKIATWDERLSTVSAEQVLLQADTSRRKRKTVIDKLAAQVFLQNYLDAHQIAETDDLDFEE